MPISAVAKLNPGGQLAVWTRTSAIGNGPQRDARSVSSVPGGKNLPYPMGYWAGRQCCNVRQSGVHRLARAGGVSYNQNTDTINQFKLEGTWHEDALKFKYGRADHARRRERCAHSPTSPYTWQTYAGYGPASSRYRRRRTDTGELDFGNSFSTGSNFINGWGNSGNLPPAIIRPTAMRYSTTCRA